MSPDDYTKLEVQLLRHEGLRLKAYQDTVGKWTIGVGYNISDRGTAGISKILMRSVTLQSLQTDGITRAEALTLLRTDIRDVERQVRERFPIYDQLDPVRQRVVIDFVFNLGTTKASAFKRAIDATIQALRYTDPRVRQAFWTEGAFHLMDSLWARQVDDGLGGRYGRADRLCRMWITGTDVER